jgi:CRP/FNR family transcriptional regulator, anaerobic regulatory protein
MTADRTCCVFEETGVVRPQEVECSECGLDPMCLLLDYAERNSNVPEGVLLRRQAVSQGEALFEIEQPFDSIYAVKSGSFKAVVRDAVGHERVVGFYFAGELIGAEGIAERRYSCSVRALEPSQVCILRLDRLDETGRPVDAVQKALVVMLGREVALNQQLTSSMVRQNAEQRLAAFLLTLSDRQSSRGFSPDTLHLRMSRSDIGSYLGLARETVSRLMTKFQRNGLILIRKKHLQLLDRFALEQIAFEF